MSGIFKNDPFAAVVQAYKEHYPDAPMPDEIVWGRTVDENGEDVAGVTVLTDSGKIQVVISPDIPVYGAVEVLAHELAHVRVGLDAGHGPRWERCFENIARSYRNIRKRDEMTEEGVWTDVPIN